MMVGRPRSELFDIHDRFTAGDTETAGAAEPENVLEVRGLTRRGTTLDASAIVIEDVSFTLRKGEILGLAGLVGAGRTETARAIFGADKFDSGQIFVDGQPVQIESPIDAISHGIGFVPEDRKAQGLILAMTVRHNVALPNLDRLTRFGFVRRRAEAERVQSYVQRLQIRTPSLDQQVLNLSGGNQQKVVISKWLMLQPRIIIMDEPTRGVDVGAKAENLPAHAPVGGERREHPHDLLGTARSPGHERPHRLHVQRTCDRHLEPRRSHTRTGDALLHVTIRPGNR